MSQNKTGVDSVSKKKNIEKLRSKQRIGGPPSIQFKSKMNSTSGMWATLKRFDAYAKPMDDFRIRTRTGGVLTVMSAIVMLLLFASEIRDYLRPEMKEELFVDTSRSGKLKINLDINFSGISCDFLGLDAMDVSGEQHIDIEHNIYKRRLDLQGTF